MARHVLFCQDCKKEFNQSLYIDDLEKGSAACPHCGSKRVIQQVAAFAAATSKKSTWRISSNHPLRRLFADLVGKELAWDREVAAYVSDLLIDFVHVDNLYRVRNYRGKRLEEVGEMLVESNPLLDAPSFEREREVRKHIGDYTLFLTGLFPEHVASMPRRGLRLDSFIDYMKAGKESYRVVAAFNQFEYRHVAPLFRRLAEQFEHCVHGLNRVKRDLEALREEQPAVEEEPSRYLSAESWVGCCGGRRLAGRYCKQRSDWKQRRWRLAQLSPALARLLRPTALLLPQAG